MNGVTRLNPLRTVEQLLIDKDLSGGCRMRLGPASFVMSPEETVACAKAMLATVGIDLQVRVGGAPIIGMKP